MVGPAGGASERPGAWLGAAPSGARSGASVTPGPIFFRRPAFCAGGPFRPGKVISFADPGPWPCSSGVANPVSHAYYPETVRLLLYYYDLCARATTRAAGCDSAAYRATGISARAGECRITPYVQQCPEGWQPGSRSGASRHELEMSWRSFFFSSRALFAPKPTSGSMRKG